MIKINLLSEERRPRLVQPARTPARERDWASLLLFGTLALGLLIIAGRYYTLYSTIKSKDAEIADVRREVEELLPIIREVEEFEEKKAELERRISVINTLQARQRGPVHLMDSISKALPEMLWLNNLQAQGNRINLKGRAFNTNATANFIDNLDQVQLFEEPVLKDIRRQGETYSFVIDFSFAYEDAAKAQAAPESDELTVSGS